MRNLSRLILAAALLSAPLLTQSATIRHVLPGGAEQLFVDYAALVKISNHGGSGTRVTTIASQQIFVGPTTARRVIIATTTVGTFAVFDDADGTCSSGQKTGTITPAAGSVIELGIEVTAGLCILTGGTAIDMTVVYQQ